MQFWTPKLERGAWGGGGQKGIVGAQPYTVTAPVRRTYYGMCFTVPHGRRVTVEAHATGVIVAWNVGGHRSV